MAKGFFINSDSTGPVRGGMGGASHGHVIESAYSLNLKTIELGKKIGRLEVQENVHGWMKRHAGEISIEAFRELLRVIRLQE